MTRVRLAALLFIAAFVLFGIMAIAVPTERVLACGDNCPTETPPPPPSTCDDLLNEIIAYQYRLDHSAELWDNGFHESEEEYRTNKQAILDSLQAKYDAECVEQPPEEPPQEPTEEPGDDDDDGRVCPTCNPAAPVIFYPVGDAIEIYTADGQPYLIADEAFFAELPDEVPDVNTELWQAEDGLMTLYRLDTGEYQFNYGPDADGNVNVLIFDIFPTFIYQYLAYNVNDIIT